MPTSVNVVIRDALMEDVAGCLALDHGYETDHVWQMHIRQDDSGQDGGWQVTFRNERLPRMLEGQHHTNQKRLEDAVAAEHCFVVASERESGEMLGYLVMRRDAMQHIGQIIDFAVDREVRRCGIGTRLLSVARNWGKEHEINRLQVAIQTTNYPAITFLQGMGFSFCGFNDLYYPNRDIAVFFSHAIR